MLKMKMIINTLHLLSINAMRRALLLVASFLIEMIIILILRSVLVKQEVHMSSGGMMGNAGGAMSQSVVGSCDVENCTYNQARMCTAGSIQVTLVDGMAHCATYTPSGGAMGVGSTGVADTTRAAGTDDTMRSSGGI